MKTIIFLYVIIFGYNSSHHSHRVKMPNMKICQESVQVAKVKVPSGGEAEAGVAVFCGTENHQTQYGRQEWKGGL